MIQKLDIILTESNPEDIKTILLEGLHEYNESFLGPYEKKNFAIYVQDEESAIIAGIHGFIIEKHKTMRLEWVWVHNDHRRCGIGTQLVEYIEKYAISKKCQIVQVSTLEFQATEFYRKMGYTQISVTPEWFCDKDEFFFSKELSPKNERY